MNAMIDQDQGDDEFSPANIKIKNPKDQPSDWYEEDKNIEKHDK